MNGSDLLNAVARADEKYISEAENTSGIAGEFAKRKRKKRKAALAAAGCLCFAAAAFLIPRGIKGDPVIPKKETETNPAVYTEIAYESDERDSTVPPASGQDVTAQSGAEPTGEAAGNTPEAEIYQVPKWDALTELERFTSLSYEGGEYTVSGKAVSEGCFTEQLGTARVRGYDLYTDTEFSEEVTVFTVRGVRPACAVGVKFADGVCGAYLNMNYRPATLGQFLGDLGLAAHLVLGKAQTYYFDAEKRYHTVDFDDFDDQCVWDMLLDDPNIENRPEEEPNGSTLADIAASVPPLGIENLALWITDNGYLCSNLLGTLKCFYIGTQKTEAFAEYLYRNVNHTDTVPGQTSGDTAVTEITEMCLSEGYIPE